MTRYRKRPVVIDAWQWANDSDPELPDWLDGRVRFSKVAGGPKLRGRIFIETLEGIMAGDPGDWIIQGTKGELYPCKPHIFAEIYEPAEAFE